MNKKTVKVIAFVIVVAMIITSFSFVIFLPSAFADAKEDTSSKEYLLDRLVVMQEYLQFIEEYFKDDVDYELMMNAAMQGATEALGDPYSEFYISTKESDSFQEAVSGEYAGVGISVTMLNDGRKQVVTVNQTGPAKKAGIEEGDIIIKVDGTDVLNLTLEQTTELLKGEAGTKVNVTVSRDGVQKEMEVTRESISSECVSYKMLDDKIGYILLSSFDMDADKEYRFARIALVNSGAESLIIDVRNNGGGYIDKAIEIANDMIEKGDIAHFVQQGEIIETEKATGTASEKLPTVMLVNENSASATELLAGALQDNNAAKLVGTTTFGKGVAQNIITLSSGDTAKLSIFYFITPNKHEINHVGITPDYIVKNGTEGSLDAQNKYNTFAPMSEASKPTQGDTGLNVYGAQQRLEMLGYYKGSITGTMDEATVEALKKFQKNMGLYPYGALDNTTKTSLEQEAYSAAYGYGDAKEDLQLAKAIELLK